MTRLYAVVDPDAHTKGGLTRSHIQLNLRGVLCRTQV